LECFEQALAMDGQYAPAHAGIAMAMTLLGFYGYVPAYDAMPRARRSAQIALDRDPTLVDARAAVQFVSWCYDWDWGTAEREFHRTTTIDPRFVTAYVSHAVHLSFAHGRHDEALAAARRAVEIDPLSAIVFMASANAMVSAGLWEEAEQHGRRAVE